MRSAVARMKKFHLHGAGNIVFLTAPEVAKLANVSLSTAHRWIDGATVPPGLLELMQLKVLGLVPGLPGFRCIDGVINTPNRYSLNASQLEHAAWLFQNVEPVLRENSRLKEETRRLREWLQQIQPEPPVSGQDGRRGYARHNDPLGGRFARERVKRSA